MPTDTRIYLTEKGIARYLDAVANQQDIEITHMVIDSVLLPDKDDPKKVEFITPAHHPFPAHVKRVNNTLIMVGDIPVGVGGFQVNGVAFVLADNTIFAYARGFGDHKSKTDPLRIKFEVSSFNSDNVTNNYDASALFVTHQELIEHSQAHKGEADPHIQYLQKAHAATASEIDTKASSLLKYVNLSMLWRALFRSLGDAKTYTDTVALNKLNKTARAADSLLFKGKTYDQAKSEFRSGLITSQRQVSDSVTSTSSVISASLTAVKRAYAKAEAAYNLATSKMSQAVADTRYLKKTDSAPELGGQIPDYYLSGSSKEYVDIIVGGDANKYYPVSLSQNIANGYSWGLYNIGRAYNGQAPSSWHTSSHKGGLTLGIEWSGDTSWGGNNHNIRVPEFDETYSTMVGGIGLSKTKGLIIWLRGGGATYRVTTPRGKEESPTIHHGGLVDSGDSFPVKDYDAAFVKQTVTDRQPVRNHGELFDRGERVYSPNNKPTAADVGALTQAEMLALRCGEIMLFDDPNPRAGWVDLDGAPLSRTTDALLWAHAQKTGLLISQALKDSNKKKYAAYWGTGDGSTTFTRPNPHLVGAYTRATPAGVAHGEYQGDAIRNFTGKIDSNWNVFNETPSGTSGVFKHGNADYEYEIQRTANAPLTITGSVLIDASLQVPTAAENRPHSINYAAKIHRGWM